MDTHATQVLIAFAIAGPSGDGDPANSSYRMLVSTLLDVFRDDTRATAPNLQARFKLMCVAHAVTRAIDYLTLVPGAIRPSCSCWWWSSWASC